MKVMDIHRKVKYKDKRMKVIACPQDWKKTCSQSPSPRFSSLQALSPEELFIVLRTLGDDLNVVISDEINRWPSGHRKDCLVINFINEIIDLE